MPRKLSPLEARQRQRSTSGVLRPEEVAEIKRQQNQGLYSDRELARIWCMSVWTIRAIRRGETWGWVEASGEAGPELPQLGEASPEMQQQIARSLEKMKSLQAQESALERLLAATAVVVEKEAKITKLLEELNDETHDRTKDA